MVKHYIPKRIVFDKDNYFKNLNNWNQLYNTWCGFNYEGDGTDHYEFTVDYLVDDDEISVCVEVCHTWMEHCDEGDCFTPPYYTYDDNSEVDITQVLCNGDEMDMEEMTDLLNRLEFYIRDSIVEV